ncbi:SsrA-binding protein SmpB [Cohnella sp. GCM10027633]|uniref:SsrA-binding protein SmpB n=1 Tax=unclassified Cohnella TaxID=2636738 RepID=UPI0036387F45
MAKKKDFFDKPLAQNKKASHDYFIEEAIEAGMVLTGTEIKSLRNGRSNMSDAFATIRNGEAFIHNFHISPFEQGNRHNPDDPTRARKLLLHKSQIKKLLGTVKQEGYTLVPLKVYIKNGYAKLLIGVGRGKKQYDKRETAAKRDVQRDIQRILREKQKVSFPK